MARRVFFFRQQRFELGGSATARDCIRTWVLETMPAATRPPSPHTRMRRALPSIGRKCAAGARSSPKERTWRRQVSISHSSVGS